MLEIGKDDQGQVVGLEGPLRLLEDIPNKVQSLLGIVAEVNLKSGSGREYLEIVVEPHPNPISFRGEFHYRSGSTKQVLRGAALSRFLLQRYGRTWDNVPLPGVAIGELDARKLEDYRRLGAHSQRLPGSVLQETDDAVIEKLQLREGETAPTTSGATPATTPTTPVTTPVTTPASAKERILALLKAEPRLTQRQVAERVGLTRDGVKYHIKALKAAGVIRRTGSSTSGRWRVLK